MNGRPVALASLFSALCIALAMNVVRAQDERHTVLTIKAFANLVDEPSEGGIDISIGSKVLIPDLQPCGHRVVETGLAWARENGYVVSKDESKDPKHAIVHFNTDASNRGFFEMLYVFRRNAAVADFSFDFIAPSGVASGAEYHDLISKEAREKLELDIRRAMACRD
ncbi:MAG: hypothetical protein MJA83_09135 [Gammaproteobacteria bacterium]|nr:hypothetical protein [Gammaproteobacteria bacterium]